MTTRRAALLAQRQGLPLHLGHRQTWRNSPPASALMLETLPAAVVELL